VEASDPAVLRELVRQFTIRRPEVRRECVEFLQRTVSLSPQAIAGSNSEIVHALWDALEFDLSELDEYGGNDVLKIATRLECNRSPA